MRNSNIQRICKGLSLATTAILVSACSMVQLGYSMAPSLINWELSRYVTFSAAQQASLDKHLEVVHEWHRQSQLPAYVALLEQAHDRLSASQPVHADDLRLLREQVYLLWNPVAERLAPAVAQIVMTFEPEQFDQIEAAQKKKIRQWRDQYGLSDKQKRREARLARWQKRLSYFLGDLTEVQQVRLSRGLDAMTDRAAWWQGYEQRQQETLTMLRTLARDKPSRDVAVARIRQWLVGAQFSQPDRRRMIQGMLNESDALTARILRLASKHQVANARKVLAKLANDLRSAAGLARGDLPSVRRQQGLLALLLSTAHPESLLLASPG